ncbi:MAG: alpha/beta hydrolase fold domain-containing protein [Rhodobacteraceae bacterium]|nr:alpha/beta hydrolase fold domain-containing protein [Paracoccaceae bacterium]
MIGWFKRRRKRAAAISTPADGPQSIALGGGLEGLYLPSRAPERALILCFHGGGGVGGAPEMMVPFCQNLSDGPGIGQILLRYSVLDNGPTDLDAILAEAHRAAKVAQEFAYEAGHGRLYLLGASFGGLMALDVFRRQQRQIAGLILFNPVTDIGAGGFTNRICPPEGRPDISPIQLIGDLSDAAFVPCMMAHGQADPVVPIETTRRFAALWPADRCTLTQVPRAQHGFFNLKNHVGPMAGLVVDFVAKT